MENLRYFSRKMKEKGIENHKFFWIPVFIVYF